MATLLSELLVKLTAETSQYNASIQHASKQIKTFADDTSSALDTVKGAFEALGVGLSVAAIEEFTKALVNSNAEFINLSASTGIAIEALSQLQKAAQVEGVDNLAGGLARLEKAMGAAQQGSAVAQAAFLSLGISTKDLAAANGDTLAVYFKMADAFAKYADGANKSAIANTLLGRGQQDNIALLDKGSQGIKASMAEMAELGGTVTPQLAAQSKELTGNISKLGVALGGLANEALGPLLPDLIAFTVELEDAGKAAIKTGDAASSLVEFVREMKQVLGPVIEAFRFINNEFDDFGKILDGIAKRDPSKIFEGFGKAVQDFARDNSKAADTVKTDIDSLQKFLGNAASIVPPQAIRTAPTPSTQLFDETAQNTIAAQAGAPLAAFGTQAGDTAKQVDSAFMASFGAIKTEGVSAFGAMTDALTGYRNVVEAAAHETANLAAAPAKTQVPLFDPAAYASIKALDLQLQEQVATFGKGANAALEYSLAHGKLAEEIRLSGVAAATAMPEQQAHLQSILKSVAALHALGIAADVKRVQDYIAKLQDEVVTFDQGSIAAGLYALAHGKLAEQLAHTGDAHVKLTAQIKELIIEQSVLKDHDAIVQLGIHALTATGQIEAATKATFELANQVKRADLTQAANAPLPTYKGADIAAAQAARDKAAADLVQLDTDTKINDVQAQANQLLADRSTIESTYDAQVAAVNLAVTNYQKTEIDGQQEVAVLRAAEQVQLNQILAQLNAIPGAMNQPAIADAIRKMSIATQGFDTEIHALSNTIRGDFVNASTTAFTDFVMGTKTASQALKSFLSDIERQLLTIANKKLFENIFSTDGLNVGGLSKLFGSVAPAASKVAGAADTTALTAAFTTGATEVSTALDTSFGAAAATLDTSLGATFVTGGVTLDTSLAATFAAGGATAAAEIAAAMAAGGAASGAMGAAGGAMGASMFAAAGGGPIAAGQLTLVGEVGPELLVSDAGQSAAAITKGGMEIPADLTGSRVIGAQGPEFIKPDISGMVIPSDKFVSQMAERTAPSPKDSSGVVVPSDKFLSKLAARTAAPLPQQAAFDDSLSISNIPRRAGGGAVSAGMPYLVGEEGPEMLVPGAAGTVVPNNALGRGGTTIHQVNHFSVPGGQPISRQTQQQLAAAAGMGVAQAQRRRGG
jgi:hypothetical protein